MKNTYASKIYATVAAKHPEWSQKKVYSTVKLILTENNAKRSAKAVAVAEA